MLLIHLKNEVTRGSFSNLGDNEGKCHEKRLLHLFSVTCKSRSHFPTAIDGVIEHQLLILHGPILAKTMSSHDLPI